MRFHKEALALLLASPLGAVAADRPNIVWFISEDNSPLMGSYGDPLAVTPNLDKFAGEGVRYTNAFANAPVCAPSRSTIITGMYPPTLGSQHMRSDVAIRPEYQFFPKYLKDAGYFTTLRLKKDYNIPDAGGSWDKDAWWDIPEAFEGRREGQPFFLMYNTWMTHEGEIFRNKKKGPTGNFRTTFESKSREEVDRMLAEIKKPDPAAIHLPEYHPDLPEVREDWARLYEMMQMMDVEFGHVLKELEKQGELENTIIIYSSDHGGVLARSKRFAFDSGLRVPLIIRFPEKWKHLAPAGPGSKLERVVSFVDMAPTLLNVAGLPVPDRMQGRPFLGPGSEPEDAFAFGFRDRMDETYDLVRTYRDKKYRYIRNFLPHHPAAMRVNFLWRAENARKWQEAYLAGDLPAEQSAFFEPRDPEELYDVSADPDEVRNLAADPAFADVLKAMRTMAGRHLREILDSGFVPEGELFARFEADGTLYQDYVASLPVEAIIDAAERATREPDAATLKAFLASPEHAIRFWGAVGGSIFGESDPELMAALRKCLEDPSGDVAAAAAEALFVLGDEASAIPAFERLLEQDNPYVTLRTANALEATGATSPRIRESVAEISKRDPKGRFRYAASKCRYLDELFQQSPEPTSS